MNTINFLWVVPALPLLGAFLNLVFGRSLSRQAVHFVAVASVAAACFTSIYLVAMPLRQAYTVFKASGFSGVFDLKETVYTWIQVGNFKLDLAFRLDPLSSVMILIVT